ncbi:MAG: hypothetical protein R2856_34210 [Caldilineaceae bacterium]
MDGALDFETKPIYVIDVQVRNPQGDFTKRYDQVTKMPTCLTPSI